MRGMRVESPAASRMAEEAEARALALERRAMAILEEAEETASARLRLAGAQVQEMLERAAEAVAQVEAEARAQGHEAGHAEGLALGVEAGRSEAETLLARARSEANAIARDALLQAESIRAQALEERGLLLESAREQLLDLAFAMAQQILKVETAVRPDMVVPMLEAALAKMKGEEEPQIRVHPAVLATLDEHRGRLLAALPGVRRLDLSGDPGLQIGDFVAQGSQGFVDGRMDRQVQQLSDQVRAEER